MSVLLDRICFGLKSQQKKLQRGPSLSNQQRSFTARQIPE